MSTIRHREQVVQGASRAARHALVLLLLTSVHHVYGAILYQTPWRYHAVLFSAAAALVMISALALQRGRAETPLGRGAWWVLVLTTLVTVLLIGAFEGGYNHLLKNLVYFAGVPANWMSVLFPPPRYELPNDLLFEVTGVLQVVPAVTAAGLLYRAVVPVATPGKKKVRPPPASGKPPRAHAAHQAAE
jgi:hypothetical protein